MPNGRQAGFNFPASPIRRRGGRGIGQSAVAKYLAEMMPIAGPQLPEDELQFQTAAEGLTGQFMGPLLPEPPAGTIMFGARGTQLPKSRPVGGRALAQEAMGDVLGERLGGIEKKRYPEAEADMGAITPEFGKSLKERIAGIRSKEDEVNLMIGITEALSRIGDYPSANEILLGLPPRPRAGISTPLLEESRSLAERRRGLEMREETPEWDPKSSISTQARKVLGDLLGTDVAEDISAGQIKEQFGRIGSFHTETQKLEMARRKERKVPNDVVKELARGRAGLKKLRNVDQMYSEVKDRMGPIWSRWNTFAKKWGLDDERVSATQAELRDAFAKYLYGTSGKQLSNREIDFMNETAAQAYMKQSTFKELLQSMRKRQLEEYNTMLEQQAANDRDIEPHLLPGWSYSQEQGIQWGPQAKKAVRVQRGNTEAIKEFQRRNIPYEVY